MLALPVWFSASPGDSDTCSTPFAPVAYAGHVLTGGWCECGAPGCICDPGEEQTGHGAPVTDQTKRPVDQGVSPIRERSGFDFGTGALILALALIVWSRLRV